MIFEQHLLELHASLLEGLRYEPRNLHRSPGPYGLPKERSIKDDLIAYSGSRKYVGIWGAIDLVLLLDSKMPQDDRLILSDVGNIDQMMNLHRSITGL